MKSPAINPFSIEANVVKKVPVITHPDLFDAEGILQPQPKEFWRGYDRVERATFGHAHGLYAFPTIEGIAYIRELIDNRMAIEIGSGNGGFCKALGIPGTDNYQQAMPQYKRYYDHLMQPTVKYGSHVEKLDAGLAVGKYQPKVVVACWVTHLYIPQRHELGGNEIGVDEHFLLSQVDDYIFIGDTHVHSKKPIFQDYHTGALGTHYIADMIVDNDMFPSRGMKGDSFLVHLKRK